MKTKEATTMNGNMYRVVSKDRVAKVHSTSMEMAVAQFKKVDLLNISHDPTNGQGTFGLFGIVDDDGNETDEMIAVWKI